MAREFKPYPFTAERFEARLPALADGVERQRHQVVIVGAGPVGFATALGLARHGVRSVLIEADDSVCFGSRAICISRRSLQILERLGAAEGFLEHGLAWTGGRSFYRDAEVLRFSMPQDELQKLPPMVNLAQYRIEQILLDEALALRDLIDIRWQTRVTALESRADGVELALENPAGRYRLRADWLVAADGGRSTIREALGLKLEGTTYEGRYVIVDILMRSERPTERLAFFDPPSNPGSTVLLHKQPDDVWRIDYQLRPDEDPDEAVKPERVIPRVESLLNQIGETADWSPIWITLYKANALTLPRYRHGRVLLAGDAAHLVPIFGVRGANSGIDDADNLAWKLAWVVQGRAGERLLDTYSDERVAAARENLRQSAKSTEFMAPPSSAFAVMRTAVLGLAGRHPEVRSLINPRQTSAISYVDSPLNEPDDPAAPFEAGPAPGTVPPECPLTLRDANGERDGHLTDLLGRHPTVLACSADGRIDAGLMEAIVEANAEVALRVLTRQPAGNDVAPTAWDRENRLFALLGAQPGTVYLLRPDGHVCARWRSAPAGGYRVALDRALQRLARGGPAPAQAERSPGHMHGSLKHGPR